MKTTIRNLIIAWVLAHSIIGCTPSPYAENQATYEGTEIKEEFLAEHSGEYFYENYSAEGTNTKSISINRDGTYEIKFQDYKIEAGDKLGRTAVCTGSRTGTIMYVRKIDAEIQKLTTGFSSYFFGKPRHLDAYLFLGPSKTEVTSSRTEKYSTVTQKSELLKGDMELTPEEIRKACTGYKDQYPEVFYIERILPNALLVMDQYRSNPRPPSERFLTKKKNDWIWITGDLVREMVAEGSERLSNRIDNVRAYGADQLALKWPNSQLTLKGKIEADMTGQFKFHLGSTFIEQFYPLFTIEGNLLGASYQPSSKEFVLHVESPKTELRYTSVGGYSELDESLQRRIHQEVSKFSELQVAIGIDKPKTLQIGVNLSHDLKVNIFSKRVFVNGVEQ
jgi:hypothetical protein